MTSPATTSGSPVTAGAASPPSTLIAEVQRVFADVTRYPQDVLEPDANIEEDLGIDSVKLGEIFAVLRENYGLPEQSELQRHLTPDRLRTIAAVTAVVAEHARPRPATGSKAGTPTPAAPAAPAKAPSSAPSASGVATAGASAPAPQPRAAAAANAPTVDDVRQVFAEVTRYPLDLLEPNVDLEQDLGIDSVKLGEIAARLRDRYALPEGALAAKLTQGRARTIEGVTAVLGELVTTEPAAPPPAAPKRMSGPAPRPRASGPAHEAVEKGRPFDGKITLVTGSGRGLCKAIAQHLAGLGATVVVNSFHSRAEGERTTEEIIDAGGSAVHLWASVANDEQRESMFDEIESRFGALDFFINGASNGILAPLDQVTSEQMLKAYSTNVVGLHGCAMRAAKLMQKRGGGRILTISMTASDRYVPYAGCMAPVKAAIESLTRYLAVELAPYNIQVNCIKAGGVTGGLLESWPESATLIPQWEARVPAGRMTAPEDVCALAAALLGDELGFLTGSMIVLDGGHSLRL